MNRWVLAVGLAAALGACTPTPQSPSTAAKHDDTTSSPVPPPAASPTPIEVPATPAETWLLPGDIGPLTTRLQLETRFGKANMREETFDGAEGIGSYPALVVFPDDPRKRLELVLDANDPDAPIRELRVASADSLWHDASGLRTGMTLAELAALNDAPVSFYGLDWDYGGTVQDWHGGKLANAVDNPLFHRVTLSARAGAGDAALPSGDTVFRSDDGKWPGIGKDLVVAELGISWPNDGDE
ncbi:hypothetical protein [Thermomonas sp. HDW16]|uniref:hypothetical protein n=1 Tax=Thermomonas sp. HDW16 TaxID=2714945 RepID=UPI00140C3F48|nr:hypothetical protein [Thermomonas sp. HDW16]QIL20065.1 hypothetical protein G7079_04565 [Thermomonas sp. HDW16]